MLLIKAFHIIAMVAWFAGLFYLPRLFVYHASTTDAPGIARFKIMERKLYRFIMVPAMLATLITGLALLNGYAWNMYKSQGWLHAKLTLVILLIGYHHVCGALVKKFAADKNTKSHRWYRVFNEIPTVLLIVITILAVVKPF